MMKIKEAVKCVPVILGYFLLTEIGKMIEFWILWHIKRKVIYMSNNGVGSLCRKAGSFRSREEQDCCLLH